MGEVSLPGMLLADVGETGVVSDVLTPELVSTASSAVWCGCGVVDVVHTAVAKGVEGCSLHVRYTPSRSTRSTALLVVR